MSVRITRSSIALGLCLLSGCLAISENTIRTGTPEEVRTTLSEMLDETISPFDSYLTDGVRNLVRVMNDKSLTSSGSGNYPEQARLEALRQLIAYSRTSEANKPGGRTREIPAEGIRAALVYTYNRTATAAMKREILNFFDTPERYPELISNGKTTRRVFGDPLYSSESNHYHSSSNSVFSPSKPDWEAVFEACPSTAQWGALFEKEAKPCVLEFQGTGIPASYNISLLSDLYDKIKQPTYKQKYFALVLLNPYQEILGISSPSALKRKEPGYKTYIRSVTGAQQKALNSMPKSEVLQLLKDLEPLRQKNKTFDYLYRWVWLKRVATHQQRADFAKAEENALNQAKQQERQELAQEKAQRKAREAQRKAREEAYNRQQEQDRKTRVVIYCNICECEREDNKRSAMEWQRNSKTVEEANEERYAKAFVESGQGDYGGSSRLGATECDYCPHLPSFHRIVEQ